MTLTANLEDSVSRAPVLLKINLMDQNIAVFQIKRHNHRILSRRQILFKS